MLSSVASALNAALPRLSPKACPHVEESPAVNRMGEIPANGKPYRLDRLYVLHAFADFLL